MSRDWPKKVLVETISLSTPRGRLIVFSLITLFVYLSKYEWLSNLSLWKRIGWESAPSIGLTRAYWQLLHGSPVEAWRRNWLIYAVLFVVIVIMAIDLKSLTKRAKEK